MSEKSQEVYTRAISAYQSAMSFLALISSAGIAATAAIVQTTQDVTWYSIVAMSCLFLSLISCFVCMSCLVGQADSENPSIRTFNISLSSFLGFALLGAGTIFLMISFFHIPPKKETFLEARITTSCGGIIQIEPHELNNMCLEKQY